jgi:hypothetical protein
MHKRIFIFLVLSAAALALSACGLEKPGTAMEHYRPTAVPKAFDAAMAARWTDGSLRAGVKVVDITPYDRNAWIAGFQQMRKSRDVLDPVTARIVYLDDGREAVVLISLDLVGFVNYDVNRLRSLITAEYPRRIQISSTHNHEAPDPIGYWGPGLLLPVQRGVDPDWFAKTLQSIALGVNDAVTKAQPAQIALGETVVEPGWSDNIWFPEGTGPNDRRMGVMRLEKLDGTPIATIANWACHAETLLDNHSISADFPGRYDKYIEKRGGGTGVFFSGALGGMISADICRFDKREEYSDLNKRIAWMDRMGDRLAELAIGSVAHAPRDAHPRIAVRSADFNVPIENPTFIMMARRGILPLDKTKMHGNIFPSEVGLVKIGGAWMAMTPGEAFPKLGMKLKDAMPFAQVPWVVGLANDELAYMMMPDQWQDPHYDYERSMSTGSQTGRLVYEAFLELLAREI